MSIRHVAVIDIGKTNAKLALVDLECREEIAVEKIANSVRKDGLYPHHDVETLWHFIVEGLARLGKRPVDAISVTTHGATAVLLDRHGGLALPVLDYEHDGPDAVRSEYQAVRPSFAETGSPSLPLGLNIGAQLFWQASAFPDAFADTASILMYPQYWAFRLSGILANEVTSLGCHSDLWNPADADFSSLVDGMGWRRLFAPLRSGGDVLGQILPQLAAATGLNPTTPVLCGIHDSNASLLPHLLAARSPFSVVSTGTWVVAMAIGGSPVRLDPTRDCLINVNLLGNPVPSARFMGGREFAVLTEGITGPGSDDDVGAVLGEPLLLTPSVQRGSGPFPHRNACWLPREPTDVNRKYVASSLYLAMMTATSLDLIGAQGPIIVEGPFAANTSYCRMLEAATGRPVVHQAQTTGTSIGAALLAAPATTAPVVLDAVAADVDPLWIAYAGRWRAAVAGNA